MTFKLGGVIIKNINDIKVYLCLFIYFAFLLANYSIRSMDEIWCFGFSNRVAEGYIPYMDFNLIITPIFVVIGSFFTNSFWLFRLYGAIISSGLVFMTYHICKKNNLDRYITMIFITINGLLILLSPFANYNTMLLFALMAAYLMANRYFLRLDASSAFIFGISLALTFLVKQNVPTVLILIFSGIVIYQWLKKKIVFKTLFMYLAGVLMPIGFFFVMMILAGSLRAFVDYSIFGMKSFASISSFQLGAQLPVLISVVITCLIVRRFVKSKNNQLINLSTLIFSVCSYLFVFPLTDWYHSPLVLIFHIPLASSILVDSQFHIKRKSVQILLVAVMIELTIGAACLAYVPGREEFIRSQIDPYRGIYISKDLEKKISAISEYIINNENMGFDVAIIDGTAYLYNLPAHDYNGILDLLNTGNIGTKTNNEIIEIINQKDIILAAKDYKWQDMQVFKDYVEANYIKSGTIGDKIIYIKP